MNKQSGTMTKIKISYIALLAFTLLYILFFEGGIKGFREGWDNPFCSTCGQNPARVTASGSQDIPWIINGCFYLLVVAYISIGIAFFVKLYQLIASIGQNKIFEMTNIKRVTSLGWLAILIGIITYQLNYLFFYIKNAPGLQHEGEIYKAELPAGLSC